MILPDSNIWIYYLDPAFPEHDAVRKWFDGLQDEELLIPAVVQMEVVHYLQRTAANAQEVLEAFFAQEGKRLALDESVLSEATAILAERRQRGIGTRDACILVHAQGADAMVATHDRDLLSAAEALKLESCDPLSDSRGR